jgi:hypothetical protein
MLFLFAACAHVGPDVGRCRDGCTADPEIETAMKACIDSEYGRLCGYRVKGDPCVSFLLREACDGPWSFQGEECDYGSHDHGT